MDDARRKCRKFSKLGENMYTTQIDHMNLHQMEHLERILIMYPYEFRNEKILKDIIDDNEKELFRRCIDTIPNLIWDSQKASLQNEADEHQRKADELAEVMNDGISPYHWCVCKNFDQYINGIHYKANYTIYLEKI